MEGDGPQLLLVTQRVYSVCVYPRVYRRARRRGTARSRCWSPSVCTACVCTRVCTGEPGGGGRPAVAAGHPACVQRECTACVYPRVYRRARRRGTARSRCWSPSVWRSLTTPRRRAPASSPGLLRSRTGTRGRDATSTRGPSQRYALTPRDAMHLLNRPPTASSSSNPLRTPCQAKCPWE